MQVLTQETILFEKIFLHACCGGSKQYLYKIYTSTGFCLRAYDDDKHLPTYLLNNKQTTYFLKRKKTKCSINPFSLLKFKK